MRDYSDWIGKTEERRDVIRPWPAEALHYALDMPGAPPRDGDPLPPAWRWLYFPNASRRADLGRDGHPEKGKGLIPPTPLPRRIWMGGRFLFQRPLRVGAEATRLSTLTDARERHGAHGPECIVMIKHEIVSSEGLMETEEQELVFRRDPRPGAPEPAPPAAPMDEQWRRVWTADPPLLFRYAALTYDPHRVHYDLEYCLEVEGYEGLVVQPALLSTLMLDLARERGPDLPIESFSFRTASPVFHKEAFEICGKPFTLGDGRAAADLWVRAAGPSGAWGGRLGLEGRVIYGGPPPEQRWL